MHLAHTTHGDRHDMKSDSRANLNSGKNKSKMGYSNINENWSSHVQPIILSVLIVTRKTH